MPRLLGAVENEEERNRLLEASRYKYSKGAVSPGEHQCDVSKRSGNQDRRWQKKGCQCCSCDKRGNLSAHETPVIETKTFTRFGSRANPKRDEADAALVFVLVSPPLRNARLRSYKRIESESLRLVRSIWDVGIVAISFRFAGAGFRPLHRSD